MEEFFDDYQQDVQSIDFGRYFKAIFRRWWLVGIVSAVIIVPWVLYIKSQPPEYRAEAWVSFERVAGVSQNLIQSRMLSLRSRSFAEDVTAQLGLTMVLQQEEGWPGIFRQDVFSLFSTTREPVVGAYELRFYPTGYCALYHETQLVDSLSADQCIAEPVSYNGFSFQLSPNVGLQRSRVRFLIKDFRGTVDDLRAREEVNFNREGTVMSIALKDSDPNIAAQTVNLLTDIFIAKSLQMSRDRNDEQRDFLETQLRVVQSELTRIDQQLKQFNNVHLMGLDEEKRRTVNELETLESDSARIGLYRRDLLQMLGKFDYTSEDFDQGNLGHYIYRQIATLPVFESDANMDLIRRRMDDYDDEKKELENQRLPAKNPEMVEVNEKIAAVENDVLNLAKAMVGELDQRYAETVKAIEARQSKLSTIPAKDMEYITLKRQQKVKEEIHSAFLRQVQEAQVSAAVSAENVSVVDPAVPTYQPVSANKKKKAAMGGFVGLFMGLMAAVLVEVADKRIKTRDDVKRYLKLPLLGVIPKVRFEDAQDMADSEKAKSISSQIVTHDYSPTPVGEAYRSLRTSLLFNKSIGEIKTLAIGSVMPGEGKSFTAANLAITLAQQKSRTLLVDADLRRGVLHNSFNVPKKPGLTNYLTGVVPVENVFNETYVPNLSLITCGSLLPNPSELLGSDRMKRFIEGISQRFDFVIFDTPPLMAATDAIILSTLVDGFAMLVRSGMTNRDDVKRKLELFQNLQANVLGVILNCAGVDVAHEGYSYYRY